MKVKQKFKHGDLVQVADDLGPTMAHFDKGCRAIVIGSYADKYGGNNRTSYTLFIEGGGETSWYEEGQLTLLGHAPELLETWKEHAEAKERDYADLKWIRGQWEQWKAEKVWPPASSILTLFQAIGFKSRFLANGEYYILYSDFAELFWLLDLLLTKPWEEWEAMRAEDAPAETVANAKRMWEAINL